MARLALALLLLLGFTTPAKACEFLVLAFDTYGANAEEEPFAWKLGHVVDVREDGATYGTKETLPRFWKIKVSGMTVEEGRSYLEAAWDLTDPDNPKQTKIRKWWVSPTDIPGAIRTTLDTVGEISVTRTQVLNYLKIKQ